METTVAQKGKYDLEQVSLAGQIVTWTYLVTNPLYEKLGIAPVQVAGEAVIREGKIELERDDFSSNRHHALTSSWSMIFSENRYPPRIECGAGFFGIMLECERSGAAVFVHVTKNRPTGFAEQYDDRENYARYADLRALIFTSPSTSSAASKMRQWRECGRR